MVCHESYQDKNGNWLYPDEVTKIDSKNYVNKKDNSKVLVGPPESMSKSKKNTIDPETMINQYGADAVRWFILSDSPPEKDVQWSDTGVASANKFLQRIYNLNYQINSRKEAKIEKLEEEKFTLKINLLIFKIDNAIDNFRFNVAIAHFYEIYNFFKENMNNKISNKILSESITNIMKLLIPFTPHLAYECLDLLKCKTFNTWPEVNKDNVFEEVNLAVQINGKTRDIISVEKDLSENNISKIINKNSKAKKFIENKKVIKTIFVKNKVINYIIAE